MALENLLPLLVPFTFFVIWMVTSVLTREAQPLPSRMTPIGETPTPPANQAPRFQPPQPQQRPRPDPRRSSPNGRVNPRQAPTPIDQGITILESFKPGGTEPGRPQGGARRPGKGRAVPAAALKVKDARAGGTISKSMGKTIGETVGAGRALTPLELPASPLLKTNTGPINTVAAGSISPSKDQSGSVRDLQLLVQNHERLREAFILAEILQPAVSMRLRRRS